MRGHSLSALAVTGCALLAWVGSQGCSGAGGGGGAATSTVTSTAATTSSATSSSTGGNVCGFTSHWNDACIACQNEHCCAELAACAADPNCKEQWTCDLSCEGIEDTACIAVVCADVGQGDSPTTLAPNICTQKYCGAECHLNPQPCDTIGVSAGACDKCLHASCCSEIQGAVGLDATELFSCQLGCTDSACLRACELAFPGGVAATSQWASCLVGSCGAACNVGKCASSGPCEFCTEASCCDQTLDLVTHASASFAGSCLVGCSGSACADCFQLWPVDTLAMTIAYYNCLTTSGCAAQCVEAPVDACGTFGSLAPQACLGCLRTSCCAESSACGSSAACAGLRACVELCAGNAACVTQCRTDHASGIALFDAMASCASSACVGLCP